MQCRSKYKGPGHWCHWLKLCILKMAEKNQLNTEILGEEGGLGLVKFWKRVPKKVHSDGYFCQKFLQQTKYFVHKQLIFCVWTAYILHKQNIFCTNSMFLAKTKYFVYKQHVSCTNKDIVHKQKCLCTKRNVCAQTAYILHKHKCFVHK